ncbi:hypothetical protein R3P38DRAFT_3178530 [Favolaschia claudopus]|uniref:Chromatin elongation factor spt5 n=1 Tax=Favolaschia claudopus TaxID=2862362 RepID=A0AAW0CUR7_9AGAR
MSARLISDDDDLPADGTMDDNSDNERSRPIRSSSPPPLKRRRVEEEEEEEDEEEVLVKYEDEAGNLSAYWSKFAQNAIKHQDVLQYLDLDAVEDGEGEDDDEEGLLDPEFIDNSQPQEKTSAPPQSSLFLPEDDASAAGDAQALAEYYEQHAAAYQHAARQEESQAPSSAPPIDLLGNLIPIANKEETAAEYYQREARQNNVQLHQSLTSFLFPPPPRFKVPELVRKSLSVANKWVRVRSGKNRKKLAFAVDETTFLVALPEPHIVELRRDQVNPLVPPDDEVLEAEGYPPWWGLLYRGQIHEFDAFAGSFHPALLTLVHTKNTPMVVAGDRVVGVDGDHKGQSGIMREALQFRRRGQLRLEDRYAELVPLRFTDDYLPKKDEPEVLDEEPGYEAPLTAPLTQAELALRMPDEDDDEKNRLLLSFPHIRRHALDFSYAFKVNDRVRSYKTDKLTYVDAVFSDHVLLRTGTRAFFKDVFRVWWAGDSVKVRWRKHAGRVGYIVDLLEDGWLQIFDPNDPPPSADRVWSEENKFCVRENDVDFYIPGSIQRFRHTPPPTVLPLRQPRPIAPELELEDVDRDNKAALRGRPRSLIGVEVQVVKKHAWKGMRGMIIGDTDSPARAARLEEALRLEDLEKMREEVATDEVTAENTRGTEHESVSEFNLRRKRALVLSEQRLSEAEFKRELGSYDGILLTVRKDASNLKIENIRIEDVVHIGTDLPLLRALRLPDEYLHGAKALRVPTPPPRQATPPGSPLASLWATPAESKLEGEDNGDWMCIPELHMKRVDVRIVGVARLPQASATMSKFEGLSGYLLLKKPIPRTEPMVMVYAVGPSGRRPKIHRQCVVPLREDRIGRKLWELVERVLVLGPDVCGDISRRGEYAQTMAHFVHTHGPGVVAVRFLSTAAPFFYHETSLALAINDTIPTQDGTFHATVF